MAIIRPGYNQGAGSDDSNGGPNHVRLSTVLRDINTDLSGVDTGVPVWSGSLTVTANTVTLTTAGYVNAIYATTGTTPGAKGQVPPAVTPAATQVRVTYSASGIPTLLFATADAVTACVVQQLKRPTSFTRKSVNAG